MLRGVLGGPAIGDHNPHDRPLVCYVIQLCTLASSVLSKHQLAVTTCDYARDEVLDVVVLPLIGVCPLQQVVQIPIYVTVEHE